MAAHTVSNSFVQTYEETVRHLAQQSTIKLRDWVQERGVQSINHNWETLGSVDASLKAPRTDLTPIDTPVSGNTFDRRVSLAQSYHVGDLVEQEDQVKAIINLNNNIAMSQGMAMKRQIDDVIIEAATADALDGGGASIPLPAEQIVGDGTTQISFDMVTEVSEKFMENDIDPDVPKIFVVGPKQIRKLLQLTEVNSSDHNTVKELAGNGMISSWMGFDWIFSTRLNIPSVDELDCLAFTRRAIGLQMNRDITARIAEDPSVSFAWRIYCYMTLGAVRVEDEHMVQVHVADAI